jgi:O-antigen/teichoic acid export membrane protein
MAPLSRHWPPDDQTGKRRRSENRTRVTESKADPAFADRVRSAVFWRSGSQIVAQAVLWTATLIVVRLLDPSDYGLFAMTQVVSVIFAVFNGSGFASALIQADSVDDKEIAQVFGMMLLLNGTLAAIQWTVAPIAAAHFNQPIIADMARVLALSYLAMPLIYVPSAILSRGLDFKRQAIANFTAALASAVTALTCATSGFGVWTLVITPLVMFYVRGIGLMVAARLWIRPSFNFRGARATVAFGGALTLCQILWVIQSQADIAIAGSRFDPYHLGLYAEALFLSQILTAKFIPPLNDVAFPSYVELKNSGVAVASAFVSTVRLTMFVAAPLYLGMAATAAPFVETLFGPKWLEMIPFIQLLALAMPFFALQIIFSPATNAMGKPGIYVRSSVAGAIIMPTAFIIGIHYGPMGLGYAWLVGAPLLLLITMLVSLPTIGARGRDILMAVLPSVLSALAMASTVWFVSPVLAFLPAPARLALLVALGGVVYLALSWRFQRHTIENLIGFLHKRKPV